MTNLEKKQILSKYIETLVLCGYSIIDLIGKPLTYFDFDKIKKRTQEIRQDYKLD